MLGFGKSAQKVFCIGFNKTGTTSLKQVFREMGWKVGKQKYAELQLENWSLRDFQPLFKYCRSERFFQDIPFSLPYTYQALDVQFPGSKFILTVRDNGDQWFDSLERFHRKIFGFDVRPDETELAEIKYHYKGWLLQYLTFVFGPVAQGTYDRQRYIRIYQEHNRAVQEYFRFRPDDLLVLNLTEPGAYGELMRFLGLPGERGDFPWLNRSD